ncbi:MAG: hypothetical protein ACYTHM_23530, partial [Planctomycetota bacterium]
KEGVHLQFDPVVLDTKAGPFRFHFPGTVSAFDMTPTRSGALRVENGLEAGTASFQCILLEKGAPPAKIRDSSESAGRIVVKTLAASRGVRVANLNDAGRLETFFTSDTARMERAGQWTFQGDPKGWIWAGAVWESGLFRESELPKAPEAARGDCLFLHAGERLEIRVSELEGGGTERRMAATGPATARSYRGVSAPIFEDPASAFAALDRRVAESLQGGHLESEAETGYFEVRLARGPRERRYAEAGKGVLLKDFSRGDSTPQAVCKARAAFFRDSVEGKERRKTLRVVAPSVLRMARSRIEPFGAPSFEWPQDHHNLRFKGTPKSIVTLRSIARQKGTAWAETRREIEVEGGGVLSMEPAGLPARPAVRSGKGQLVEGETFTLTFRPHFVEGTTRWVPDRAGVKGTGRFRLEDKTGRTLDLRGGEGLTWETVQRPDGRIVDIGLSRGGTPQVDIRFPPGAGAVRGLFSGGGLWATAKDGFRIEALRAGEKDRTWERVEVSLDRDVHVHLWGKGRDPKTPEWKVRADRAVCILVAGRRGGKVPERVWQLESLEATGNVRMENLSPSGGVEAWGKGSVLRLLRTGKAGESRLEGVIAGPAELHFTGSGQYPPIPVPAGAVRGLSWVHLTSPKEIAFAEGKGREGERPFWDLHAGSPAVLTVMLARDPRGGKEGEGGGEEHRIRLKAREMDLRVFPRSKDEAGWERMEVSGDGGVEVHGWVLPREEGKPSWECMADRASAVFIPRKGGGEEIEWARGLKRLEAHGSVRFTHFDPEGKAASWGKGSSLVMMRPEGEALGALEGHLKGPAECTFDAAGGFPRGKEEKDSLGTLRWARIETPEAIRFKGLDPQGSEMLQIHAGNPAALTLGAAVEKEAPPHKVHLEADAIRLGATRRKGEKGGWDLPEVRGEGECRVREMGPRFVVTATGRDCIYAPFRGEKRFQGRGLKVHIEPVKGK